MATTCTLAGFASGANCYKDFSPNQQRAIVVYQLAFALVGAGGQNYTTSAGNALLLIDSESATGNMTPADRYSAFVGVLNSTISGSLSVGLSPLTKSSAATAITCYKNWSKNQLENAQLFLLCQLLGLAL
jgi:hypothetical protein